MSEIEELAKQDSREIYVNQNYILQWQNAEKEMQNEYQRLINLISSDQTTSK